MAGTVTSLSSDQATRSGPAGTSGAPPSVGRWNTIASASFSSDGSALYRPVGWHCPQAGAGHSPNMLL
jgi:hypothetical protein